MFFSTKKSFVSSRFRIIPIDVTKSEWDDDDDNDGEERVKQENEHPSLRKVSPLTNRTEYSSINSASSVESTSTLTNSSFNENRLNSLKNLRLAHLKRNDRNHSTRPKSPKSVSFILEDNSSKFTPQTNETFHHHEQQLEICIHHSSFQSISSITFSL